MGWGVLTTRKLDTKGRRLIQVRLSPELVKDVRRCAVEWEMTLQDCIERLLREAIGRHIAALNAEEGQQVRW